MSKSKPKKTKPVASKPAKNSGEYVARGKFRKLAIAEAPAKTKPSATMQAGLAAVAAMPPTPPKETKLSILIKLLSRPEGATLEDMVAATGWQKHTTRAALSHALGKKRGYQIVSDKPQGGRRIYKIAEGA